jgi:hypothetical protein
MRSVCTRDSFNTVVDAYRAWFAELHWFKIRIRGDLVGRFMKLGWSKEDQDCFVALTGGSRGLLPGRGKAPYHFAPGLTDGDKDYHLNHNTDSTCSFWEMMSCRFTIQALYSNKRQFFIENDRASYHTRAWHNLWFEQSTRMSVLPNGKNTLWLLVLSSVATHGLVFLTPRRQFATLLLG